ncbi:MAG: hypothetical protein AB8B99_24535 [Phormidesmis sp.]
MMRFTSSAFALANLNLPAISLPDLSLPDLSLPDLSVSDSLSSLAALASQLQAAINGAIAHPFWAIAFLLFAITLIQITADLIKRVVKATLTFVLKLPLTLSQWIWNRATTPSLPDNKEKIQQLISELERLRTEQDLVLEQLKALVAETTPKQHLFEKSAPEKPASEKPASEKQREDKSASKSSD